MARCGTRVAVPAAKAMEEPVRPKAPRLKTTTGRTRIDKILQYLNVHIKITLGGSEAKIATSCTIPRDSENIRKLSHD
jgi:hypothetical protein